MSKDHQNLQHYVKSLGLPSAVISTISSVYAKMDARIWVIENSYAMQKKDSRLLKATANFERIEKKEGVSRWSELSQCIDFHSKMAARCWIPTKYWLVNEPDDRNIPKRFGLCWGKQNEVSGELEQVQKIMKEITLDGKVNPLGKQLQRIEKYLSKEARRLEESEEYVGVIVCTQGVPTDERGNKGQAVIKEFVQDLVSLSALPVKIIFRLCTDNDQVVDFYNTLDEDDKCACDVLDDFWGEAMEVYLHNPWLTYGIGIHRLRESGLGTELMDELDQKHFSLDEIHEFCVEFFIGDRTDIPLNNPDHNFEGFLYDLEKILLNQKLVWNPCKKKLCPWIEVDKLKRMFRRASMTGMGTGRRASYCRIPPNMAKNAFVNARNARGAGAPQAPKSFTQPPQAAHNQPSKAPFSRHASTPAADTTRTAYTASTEYTRKDHRHTDPSTRTFHRTATEGTRRRAHSSAQHHNDPFRQSAPPVMRHVGPKNLDEAIKQWAHQPPAYIKLNPMEKLLVDIPNLFPASNLFVEDHEYFDKWKEFSEDAFEGETGDDLKNLLRRAARKAKFFLHPDKLPNDLTENQTLLFKGIWDVIQESEAKTLAD